MADLAQATEDELERELDRRYQARGDNRPESRAILEDDDPVAILSADLMRNHHFGCVPSSIRLNVHYGGEKSRSILFYSSSDLLGWMRRHSRLFEGKMIVQTDGANMGRKEILWGPERYTEDMEWHLKEPE